VTPTRGSSVVIVITTLGLDADAAAFARTLIDERLAACVSILPALTSVYRWQGEVEQAREQQLLIKTAASSLAALQARFTTLHPYDVPEFVVLRPEDVAPAYRDWVIASVAST
jgi:periplasmic divalent cation tolerance protein